jgi:uncharacterized damage-inducible protein DinB
MLDPSYVRMMARYNAWQNANVFGAGARLTDAQRKENRGAFFGSIHATLNHILWADQMWMMRFGVAPPPPTLTIAGGLTLCEDWDALTAERSRIDRLLRDWADRLAPSDLYGDLTWVPSTTGLEKTRPKAQVVTHIFNHQTHHRGQVHAMLTGFGIDPGVTDLPFGPDLLAD